MKIAEFTIKNFKSIDSLENFKLNDDKICCFIGQNGSGKSNILLALNALKDNKDLIETNRYEKANKGGEIEIRAKILFEDRDLAILEPLGLKITDIAGFFVTVKKSGQDPIRLFEPLDFVEPFSKKASGLIEEVKSKIRKLTLAPDNEDKRKNLLEVLKVEKDDPGAFSNHDAEVNEIFGLDGSVTDEEKKVLKTNLSEIRRLLGIKISDLIEKEVWSRLSINLLNPGTYIIENNPLITDLATRSGGHEFAFDFLFLTGRTAGDLNIDGSDRENLSHDISENLTYSLGKVWKNIKKDENGKEIRKVKLSFEISRQEDRLIFMFHTPQGRAIELSNLSEGERWFLRFYTALAISKQKGEQVIWLLDEPGQTLHASAQVDLKNYFEEIVEDAQVFYTTHQPMMIPWHKLERIFLVENDPGAGTAIRERLWKDNDELASPLREALALFIGEEMFTGTEHVLVEGPADYIYLQGWLSFFRNTSLPTTKIWNESYSVTNRTFIPTNSSGSMPLYLLFLTHKTRGIVSSVAIPDSTKDEEAVKKGIAKHHIDPLTSVLSFESVINKKGPKKIVGIEDIFETVEFLTEVKNYYNESYPKINFPSNFLSPKPGDLNDGICKYIFECLKTENPEVYKDDTKGLDKPGVALNIYRKLIHAKKNPFSKKARDRFHDILVRIDSKLHKVRQKS